MDIENLSLTIKIIMGIVGLLFFLISHGDLSVGFWLWVIPAIIIGVILYNTQPSENTIIPIVALVGSAAIGWFSGSALSFVVGLFTVAEKIENKVNKWIDE